MAGRAAVHNVASAGGASLLMTAKPHPVPSINDLVPKGAGIVDPSTSGYPPGNLRVSDADRDRAITELAGHFQAGRLTADELDERSGRALAARTGNELAGLFGDLPPDQAAATSAATGARRASGRRPHYGWAARVTATPLAIGFVIAAAVIILTGFPHRHYHPAALIPVLVVMLVIRRLASAGRHQGGRRPEVQAGETGLAAHLVDGGKDRETTNADGAGRSGAEWLPALGAGSLRISPWRVAGPGKPRREERSGIPPRGLS